MTVAEKITELGPWFHQIEIDGHRTRDIAPAAGRQPISHPEARWRAIRPHLPELNGRRVLDVGCADGFFSIEMARLGASVDAVDHGPRMIDRLQWAADELNLEITARTGTVSSIQGSYDFVLFLGVLYHLKHPLLGLQKVATVAPSMLVETAIAPGDEPFMWFKPPQKGVHNIPKWYPTVNCLEAMLRFVGYADIEPLPYDVTNRTAYLCRK